METANTMPTERNSVAEIEQYATDHNISLEGAKNKADKLAAIEAAQNNETSEQKAYYAKVKIYDPKDTGIPQNYREFEGKDGKQRSAITLPPGTKVVDVNGVEQDASYHTLYSTPRAVKVQGDTMSIFLPNQDKNGNEFTHNLKRTWGHTENGEFVVEKTSEIKVSAASLVEALDKQAERKTERNGSYIHVPNYIGENTHAIRPVPSHENESGAQSVVVTLPFGTTAEIDGEMCDLSFHEFWSNEKCVFEDKEHSGFLSVWVGHTNNKTGEPWMVQLKHDVNEQQPDGTWTRNDEKSTFYEISPADLSKATSERCEQIREQWAADRCESFFVPIREKIASAKAAQAVEQSTPTDAPVKEQVR